MTGLAVLRHLAGAVRPRHRAAVAKGAAADVPKQRRHDARDGAKPRAWWRPAGHRNRRHEAARIGVARTVEDRGVGAPFDDLTRIHHRDPMVDARDPPKIT